MEVLLPCPLQDHSPFGEPHYTALAQTPRSSGELLVNESEHSARLALAHAEAGAAKAQGQKNPAIGGIFLSSFKKTMVLRVQPQITSRETVSAAILPDLRSRKSP